jgi:hypothetical protein
VKFGVSSFDFPFGVVQNANPVDHPHPSAPAISDLLKHIQSSFGFSRDGSAASHLLHEVPTCLILLVKLTFFHEASAHRITRSRPTRVS